MAVRVELYAKDHITATQLVEYALSVGAVLYSFAEVEGRNPLIEQRPATGEGQKRYAKAYKFTGLEEQYRPGSIRQKVYEQMCTDLSTDQELTLTEMREYLENLGHPVNKQASIVKGLCDGGTLERVF